MILLGAAGLSQIASLIFYVTVGQSIPALDSYISVYFYILGSAGVLVVLAVTWYAMSLQATALNFRDLSPFSGDSTGRSSWCM